MYHFPYLCKSALSAIELQNRSRVKHYFGIGKFGHSLNVIRLVSRVVFEPRRVIMLFRLFLQIGKKLAVQASLAYADSVSHVDIIRRYIVSFSVDCNVAVRNHLSRGLARIREAQAIDDIVQS